MTILLEFRGALHSPTLQESNLESLFCFSLNRAFFPSYIHRQSHLSRNNQQPLHDFVCTLPQALFINHSHTHISRSATSVLCILWVPNSCNSKISKSQEAWSQNERLPLLSKIKFSGFTSRCRMPLLWRYSRLVTIQAIKKPTLKSESYEFVLNWSVCA